MKNRKVTCFVLWQLIMTITVGMMAFDEKDILFYADFDQGFNANIAKGNKQAKPNGKPELCEGHKGGKALLYENQSSGLVYKLKDNLNPIQGTIAFWVSSDNWMGDNKDVMQYYFSTHGATDTMVIEHVWYHKGINLVLFKNNLPIGGFPSGLHESMIHTYDVKAIDVTDRIEPGRWYHVAFTWKNGQIVSYLNGKQYSIYKNKSLKFQKAGDQFCLGFPPYKAPIFFDILCDELALPQLEKHWRTKIDDFVILKKSLFPSQIAKLFEMGPVKYASMGEADISELNIENFPYLGYIKAMIFPGPEPEKIGKINVAITKQGAKTPIKSMIAKLDDSGVAHGKIMIKDLPNGKYTVSAVICGKDGQKISSSNIESFELLREKWWNNKIGLDKNYVPPPWKPMKLKNDTVFCWGREYRFNNTPFPEQIVSQKDAMFKSPMQLKAKSTDQKSLQFSWQKPEYPLVTDATIKRVQKGKLENLGLEVEETIDYDGFILVDLKFKPEGKVDLGNFVLEMPFNKNVATFLMTSDLKYHGFAPKKRVNFYDFAIWLGNDDIGFHWMADNLKGWELTKKSMTFEFIPEKEQTVLRANFINKQTTIDKPFAIRFMYEATPVRPRPADWRKYRFLRKSPYRIGQHKNPNKANLKFIGSCGWPAFSYSSTPGPKSKYKTWKEYRKGKAKSKQGYMGDNLAEYGINFMPYTNLLARGVKYRMSPETYVPEYLRYFDEWKMIPGRSADGPRADGTWCAWAKVCPQSKLYRDYWTYQVVNVIMGKEGLDLNALYYDIFRPGFCNHIEHGCGWIDKEGKLQGSVPILATRKLMKRIYQGLKANKPDAVMMGHCSSHVNMAFTAFVEFVLDGEQFRGGRFIARSGHYADALTNDWVRAVFTGRQYGFIPDQCSEVGWFVKGKGKIYKDVSDRKKIEAVKNSRGHALKKGMDPKNEWFVYNFYRGTREMLAVLLLHDSLLGGQQESSLAFFDAWNSHDRFGLKEKDVKFTGYWEKGDEVKCSNKKIKVSYYTRPNRIMLIISNLTPNIEDMEITIDPKKLGLPDDNLIAFNGESPGQIEKIADFDGRKLKLKLRDYDFCYIIIGPEKSLTEAMKPLKR